MVDIKELRNVTSSFSLLYVEDDKEIAQSFIAYLSKFFKEVVYAENGEEGLAFYKQQKFDLILTDINMQKMDGLEMSSRIKEINPNQNIIIVSAYSDIEKFTTSIKLGVDGYIIKPINYTDMNNLLFKIANKIKIYQENDINNEQQKFLLAEISKNNKELRQYTDVIDQVALVTKTDLKGIITYVNDFFCEVSGYSKEELIGVKQNIVRHPDMAKSFFKELWDTIESGEVWKGSIKNKTKSGEPFFVHTTIIPLYDNHHENIIEYIGIMFITTEEENKKRDFKKKVMMGYQEFRKHSADANKTIETLSKEVNNLNNEMKFEKELIQELRMKNSKLVNQINFYEKEQEQTELNYKRFLSNSSNNAKAVTEGYKKAQIKLETQKEEIIRLDEDNKLRRKEVFNLTTKLNEQSKVIRDLRDTIKNITEANKQQEQKETKKSFFGISK